MAQRANQTIERRSHHGTNTQNSTAPKAPDFIAWYVSTKGEKTFWTKVGASWLHNDGNGMTLQLESYPIGGRIVLRAPVEEKPIDDGARA